VTIAGISRSVGLFFGQEPHPHIVAYFIPQRGKFSFG
jgi:hypothetical protein